MTGCTTLFHRIFALRPSIADETAPSIHIDSSLRAASILSSSAETLSLIRSHDGLLNIDSFRLSGEENLLQLALDGQLNPIILDVGANHGNYSRAAIAQNPRANVHSFEPHPGTFRRLAATAQELGFRAHNLGCAAEPGQLTLYDYSRGDGDGGGSTHASLSRDAVVRDSGHPASETLVQVVTLDDFCRQMDINTIRLLKIDTEGFELEVLKGAKELIARGAIELIQFEFNEMHPYTRVFLRDFIEILPEYHFYRLLPAGLLPLEPYVPLEHELFAFQNIVAARRDVRLQR